MLCSGRGLRSPRSRSAAGRRTTEPFSAPLGKALRGTSVVGIVWGLLAIAPPPAEGQPPPRLEGYREFLGQVLFRDDQLRSWLSSTERRVAEARYAEAVVPLQRIFDSRQDALVWPAGADEPQSVRGLAMRLLVEGPPEFRRTYQNHVGGDAEAALKFAQLDPAFEPFAEIVRRYFHTLAGGEAAQWVAAWQLDRGDPGGAARLWERLLADPVHSARLTPRARIQAAAALAARGDAARARQLADALPAGAAAAARAMLDGITGDDDPTAESSRWPMFGGDPERTSTRRGSLPLARPVWQVPLFQPNHDPTGEVRSWERIRLLNDAPLQAAAFPIAVQGRLIFRDADGLRALHLPSGRPAWRFPTVSTWARMLSRLAGDETVQPDFDTVFASNLGQAMLTSDGERVYFVDNFGESNELLAVPVLPPGDSPAAIWKLGGSEAGRPLSGHFFLGPPFPHQGRVYAVSEAERQLNLSAIDARTGRLLWSQGLAFPLRSLQQELADRFEPYRYFGSCTPTVAAGVLICPTDAGVVLGIDPVGGAIQWVYSYVDEDLLSRNPRRTSLTTNAPSHTQSLGHLPLVSGRNVVLLSRHSMRIQALDALTGARRWRVPRGEAEYLGAIDAESVLVVGRHHCRLLALDDGRLLWSRAIGAATGRGCRVGSYFVQPLADGGLACIDMASGELVGYGRHDPDLRPGNLIAVGDLVISASPWSVAALPQSEARLRTVIASAAGHGEAPLETGEVLLRLGRLSEARPHLALAARESGTPEQQEQARLLLRELIYLELRQGDDPAARLAELVSLARTPQERARDLLHWAEKETLDGSLPGLIKVSRDLQQVPRAGPVTLVSDPGRTVDPTLAVAELRERLAARLSPDDSARLARDVDRHLEAALAANDVEELRRFLRSFPRQPQSAAVRFRLARLFREQGFDQAAELMLLQNRALPDDAVAAEASRQLVELFADAGMDHEAGCLLAELQGRFAGTPLASGQTGREYVAAYPRDQLAWRAFLRTQPAAEEPGGIRMAMERDVRDREREVFSNYRRRLTTEPLATFEILDKSSLEGTLPGRYLQVDRETGFVVGEYEFPAQAVITPPRSLAMGHLIPVGTQHNFQGLSLLERSVVWQSDHSQEGRSPANVYVGPFGPRVCIFQSRRRLIALDPATGELVWQRTDLEPNSGIYADGAHGLIGDEEAVVVFGSNRMSYRVFSSATGAELRQGELSVDLRQYRMPFGRNLLHVYGSEPRIRLWDPLTDGMLLDEPFAGVLFTRVQNSDDLLLLQQPSRLRLIEGTTGRSRLDVRLPDVDFANTTSVRAFSDADRLYVNLQRSGGVGTITTYPVNDSLLPVVFIRGETLAIDLAQGTLLWNAALPQQSMLHFPEYRLPILIGISRPRPVPVGRNQTLRVDVYDARTGRPLSTASSFPSDRLVQFDYDAERRMIELKGLLVRIQIEFGLKQPLAPDLEQGTFLQ